MATKEIASKARAILAKAYRDNGDLGAANYVEAGHDLTPDTQVHLLAIIDALANRPQPVEVPDPAQTHPEVYALANDGVSVPDDLAGLIDELAKQATDWRHNGYTRVWIAQLHDRLADRTALNQEVR